MTSDKELTDYKTQMIGALEAELKNQSEQIKNAFQSVSELKKTGFGIHPIHIVNQSFGFGEYPEITFKVPSNQSIDKFRQQELIELFSDGGVVRGAIIYLNATDGKIRLYSDDFPEWMDTGALGIRVGVDEKSIQLAKSAVEELTEKNPFVAHLFLSKPLLKNDFNFSFYISDHLNTSQNEAVRHILSDYPVSIVHGPPGTGKTTTIVEAIKQMTEQGEKVIAIAPSNMAVDHLSLSLIQQGVNVLRMGNPTKISEALAQHTFEGRLTGGIVFQELKKLKIQAEAYRKMASQYKRKFGKEEAEQRRLIWNEYRSIKKEIRQTIDSHKDKWQSEAQVICGTPVGLANELSKEDIRIVVIDEAGQCLQPLAWIAIQSKVKKLVLAGDPFQLPPTVLSDEALKMGLSSSILDLFLTKFSSILLDTQYRMREKIVGFSNAYFYDNQLKTPSSKTTTDKHLFFYDTAGTGFEEEREQEGSSYFNSGELELVTKIMEQLGLTEAETAFISPYSGQVSRAKMNHLPVSRIASIDSFQGQENQVIILSLVRSNDKQEIGFLRDYRRMNVALTRAKEKLIVIGDSSTLGNDAFYKQFFEYVEHQDAYHTAWEVLY